MTLDETISQHNIDNYEALRQRLLDALGLKDKPSYVVETELQLIIGT